MDEISGIRACDAVWFPTLRDSVLRDPVTLEDENTTLSRKVGKNAEFHIPEELVPQ